MRGPGTSGPRGWAQAGQIWMRAPRRLSSLYGGRMPSVVSDADPNTPPHDPNAQQDTLPSAGGPPRSSEEMEDGRWVDTQLGEFGGGGGAEGISVTTATRLAVEPLGYRRPAVARGHRDAQGPPSHCPGGTTWQLGALCGQIWRTLHEGHSEQQ